MFGKIIKQFLISSWYKRRRWLYFLFSFVFAATLYLSNLSPGYGASWIDLILQGAQIIQLSSISEQQEVQLGKQINQQLTSSGKVKIYRNSQLNSYINQLGQRLAKNSKRPNLAYTFQIVDDSSINAFATMGGFVYLHTGLISKADNEAQLASVLAHEIGHIGAKHAIKQMRDTAIAQGVLSATGLDREAAVQIGVDLALSRPNSREDEFQADTIGLETLKKTGYAPIGMVEFMRKLLQSKNSVPTFLSTHPATSDRIAALQKAIDPQTANQGEGLDNNTYRRNIASIR
jgi:predicted Zn-dependent protease